MPDEFKMNLYSELSAYLYIYGRETSDAQGKGLDLSLWQVCQGMTLSAAVRFSGGSVASGTAESHTSLPSISSYQQPPALC
jgi:hypothetical protein